MRSSGLNAKSLDTGRSHKSPSKNLCENCVLPALDDDPHLVLNKKILMTNTSTPYHRGGIMNASGHVYAMHDKCVYLQTHELGRPSLRTNNALGIMSSKCGNSSAQESKEESDKDD
ncbi:hypothetical protein JHK86_015915 [Glycine max]|nr:hypothetical protein JHK86_015915 [Glycine max]